MTADRYLFTLGVSLVIAPIPSGARSDIGPVLFPAHAAAQTAAEMLSAQIRAQGYRCDAPPSAVRDPALEAGRSSVGSEMYECHLPDDAHSRYGVEDRAT